MKRIVGLLLAITIIVSGIEVVPTKALDKVSDDQWKTVAIVAPENGKLIGAGHIDIKWNNNLEDVQKYSVYADSKLIKTVNASSADIQSVDFYTVRVSAHTAYVVAEKSNGTKVQSNTSRFFVTKKGICVNDVDMGVKVDPADLNVGWYYNWGNKSFKETGFSNTKFYDLEYVPMFYKFPSESYTDAFNRMSAQGYKYLLSFNEPDLSKESNVAYDLAARTWKNEYIKKKGNMLLGSPAVSVFPQWSNWWSKYWSSLVDICKQNTSFIAIHNYQQNYDGRESALQYLEEIDECYNKYRKPIWITEFALWRFDKNSKDSAKTQEFMKIVLKGLNERSYVERYSWFSPDYSKTEASSSSLFDYTTGAITPIGKIYAQIGNPSGYNAKTYGVASNINQDTSIAACVGSILSKMYWVTGKKKAFKYCIQATKGAVGYQLQYSLSKKFSKKKKYKTKIKNLGATNTDEKKGTIKKLKKKKRYYVRVRAIKQLMGKKYYCKWSYVEKVKTKKK